MTAAPSPQGAPAHTHMRRHHNRHCHHSPHFRTQRAPPLLPPALPEAPLTGWRMHAAPFPPSPPPPHANAHTHAQHPLPRPHLKQKLARRAPLTSSSCLSPDTTPQRMKSSTLTPLERMASGLVQRTPSIHSMTSILVPHRSGRTHGIFTVGSFLREGTSKGSERGCGVLAGRGPGCLGWGMNASGAASARCPPTLSTRATTVLLPPGAPSPAHASRVGVCHLPDNQATYSSCLAPKASGRRTHLKLRSNSSMFLASCEGMKGGGSRGGRGHRCSRTARAASGPAGAAAAPTARKVVAAACTGWQLSRAWRQRRCVKSPMYSNARWPAAQPSPPPPKCDTPARMSAHAPCPSVHVVHCTSHPQHAHAHAHTRACTRMHTCTCHTHAHAHAPASAPHLPACSPAPPAASPRIRLQSAPRRSPAAAVTAC